MPLSKVNTLLFDWDLTLVRSLPAVELAVRDIEELFGLNLKGLNLEERFGMHFHDSLKDIYEQNKDKLPAFAEFEKAYQDKFRHRCSLIDLDHEAVLTKVLAKGHSVGIVTYNSSIPVRNVLERYKLNIPTVIGHDDMDFKADGILKAITELGGRPESSVYIGDHSNDVLEAKKAGVRSVAMTTGFVSREELKKHEPDLILDKLEDLLKYLS
ncbi:MAG: HAD family hydrolase [Candidatus Gracilibacteria bacterium]|nr:HAD family hydrolase [Candidatus Gracilibacteria bacterium]